MNSPGRDVDRQAWRTRVCSSIWGCSEIKDLRFNGPYIEKPYCLVLYANLCLSDDGMYLKNPLKVFRDGLAHSIRRGPELKQLKLCQIYQV